MNILLLGHEDIASLYALNRLIELLPEHRYTAFTSGVPAASNKLPAALSELAQVDAKLCSKYLSNHKVSEVLRAARKLSAPNSKKGVATLRRCGPDLIVSIRYRRILRDAAIGVPRQGVLNLHSGILPDYRGVMATFWAMLNDEEEIGCTLHTIVDGTIDTGPIIGLSRTPVRTDWSYLANVLELYPDGCRMMVDAMRKISAGGTLETSPQTGESHYYSAPQPDDLERFLAMGLRLADANDLEDFLDRHDLI